MKRHIIALIAGTVLIGGALALAGCSGDPNAPAQAVSIAYIGATTAAEAYEQTPGLSAAAIAQVKACDNGAYAVVKPVSDALVAGTPPAAAVLANAQNAVASMKTCLTSLGVKLP